MKASVGALACVVLALLGPLPGWGEAAKQGDALQYVGLQGYTIQDIALAPDGQILAATHAGLWKVSADGEHILPLTSAGLPRSMDKCYVNQVVVCSDETIFISVGPGGGGGAGKEGVFRLRRGGSWEPVGSGILVHPKTREVVSTLAVLPDDTLICVVRNVSIYRGETQRVKIYRSTTAGDAWEELVNDTFGSDARSVVAGPDRQVWMVSGGCGRDFENPTCWVVVADDWRATPVKWRASALQSGIGFGGKGFGDHEIVITRVACDVRGNLHALVTDGKPPYVAGVYRSDDKGGSWKRTTTDEQATLQRLAMAASPDGDLFASSYGGVQRSQDGGRTWAGYAQAGNGFVTDLLVDREGCLWVCTSSLGLQAGNPGLFRSSGPVGNGVAAGPGPDTSGGSAGPKDPSTKTVPPEPSMVESTYNGGGAENGPTAPTVFTVREAYVITSIQTYHWNGGHGARSVTIALRHEDGTVHGPWQAVGATVQGGKANVYWTVEPKVTIKPGTYTVVDSDPSTWAQNAQSGGRGFAQISGYPARAGAGTTPPKTDPTEAPSPTDVNSPKTPGPDHPPRDSAAAPPGTGTNVTAKGHKFYLVDLTPFPNPGQRGDGGRKGTPLTLRDVLIDMASWIRLKHHGEDGWAHPRMQLAIPLPQVRGTTAVALAGNLDHGHLVPQGRTITKLTVQTTEGDIVLEIQAGVHLSEWNGPVKHEAAPTSTGGTYVPIFPLPGPRTVTGLVFDYVELPKGMDHGADAPGFCLRGITLVDGEAGGDAAAPSPGDGTLPTDGTTPTDATPPGDGTPPTDATPTGPKTAPDEKGDPASVSSMTIQAGTRKARPDEVVTVPVWLLRGAGVASLNVNLRYDPNVVTVSGNVTKGNLLASTMFEANAREVGLVRLGFAQSRDLAGTGTIAQVPFKAVGKPGDKTRLRIEVTSIASAAGAKPKVEVIDGDVVIVGENGVLPGDTDGSGTIAAVDAMNALKMSVGNLAVNLAADMDKDGQVTARDATLILLAVVGK